jgi:hypothetical protein
VSCDQLGDLLGGQGSSGVFFCPIMCNSSFNVIRLALELVNNLKEEVSVTAACQTAWFDSHRWDQVLKVCILANTEFIQSE